MPYIKFFPLAPNFVGPALDIIQSNNIKNKNNTKLYKVIIEE